MRRRGILALVPVLVAVGCSVGKAEQVVTPVGTSSPIAATTSVTYCSPGGTPLAADVWLPKSTKGQVPLVIFAHGGGWIGGSRTIGSSLAGALPSMVSHGIAFASIDYRVFRPDKVTHVPEIVADVVCAAKFFEGNASRWNIDPDRVGLLGESAGAHLVSLVGLADYLDQSAKPKAVATIAAPTDMTVANTLNTAPIVLAAFGATSIRDPIMKNMSPVTWVSAEDPPCLIVQGDADESVDPAQALLLVDRLKAEGVPVDYVPVHGGTHTFDSTAEAPSSPAIFQRVVDFFVKYLGGPK